MKARDKESPRAVSYQCPICGNKLPYEPPLPRFDAPCSECGYHLWCRRRVPSDDTELEVLPLRTPEPSEVDQLAKCLVQNDAHTRVVVDLSQLEQVDSCFVARLVSLNKLIQASGGRLGLHGLCRIVREAFAVLRLDKAFEIAESEERIAERGCKDQE
jgi:anti-anti-sigma factor